MEDWNNRELRQIYKDYKAKSHCEVCGTQEHLNFVHMDIGMKKMNIANYAKVAPDLDSLMLELDKCLCLCDEHARQFKHELHREDFREHFPESQWHEHIDIGFRNKQELALLLVGYDDVIMNHKKTEIIFMKYFPGKAKLEEFIDNHPEIKDAYYKYMELDADILRDAILERRSVLRKEECSNE